MMIEINYAKCKPVEDDICSGLLVDLSLLPSSFLLATTWAVEFAALMHITVAEVRKIVHTTLERQSFLNPVFVC
ncbi:hypothetical protein EUGRSUZ_K03582 [Eucalyptus grandis]|uniref:Uncharacterized protein n=2 Tax=Eucalyptus grandis TaxID=71139 RepID=A0ACC3J088_EUCGR|nr:hypothetical protein EUGRSUZ_K03582 [Eucalyptus grandis]